MNVCICITATRHHKTSGRIHCLLSLLNGSHEWKYVSADHWIVHRWTLGFKSRHQELMADAQIRGHKNVDKVH
jgi:hypothetical protein